MTLQERGPSVVDIVDRRSSKPDWNSPHSEKPQWVRETAVAEAPSQSQMQGEAPAAVSSMQQREPQALRNTIIRTYTIEHLKADPKLLYDIVEAYRYVFGGDPWNEWKVCSSCKAKCGRVEHGTMETDDCGSCGTGRLVDFHSPLEVKNRLFAELTMPGAAPFLFVAEAPATHTGNRVLGFTWGYSLSCEHITEHILGGYFAELHKDVALLTAARILSGMWTESATGDATYISEVGVVENARGSTLLFAQMLQAMAEQQVALGYSTWVLWTSRQSRAFPLSMLLGGKPLFNVSDVLQGDDRLLLTGDCSEYLDICNKYPNDKMVSYFIKAARSMKTVFAAK